MAKIRIVKPGYQAAKLTIFKRNSSPLMQKKPRKVLKKASKYRAAITNIDLTTSESDLQKQKSGNSALQSDEFQFPSSPTPTPVSKEADNPKVKKKKMHIHTRSKEEQKRINTEVLLIIRKSQESIQALRRGLQNKTQQSLGGKEVRKSQTGRRLAVEVLITGDHGIRKTQLNSQEAKRKSM